MSNNSNNLKSRNNPICLVGLGYVGLPLAIAFAEQTKVVGFDINQQRVSELQQGHDKTLDVEPEQLQKVKQNLTLTYNLQECKQCSIFIVTVPTPIDDFKVPDLSPLINASKMLGKILKKEDIVIYESTVYPGATEEICVPQLEQQSGLIYNQDFYCGYSPERINPGDKKNKLQNIKKVTSGSTPDIADKVNKLYQSIITAGTFKASSIKVAEASKVIENTQRDINIALVNELALIFNRLEIDTEEVLKAAETKWNFLPFRPGLVGGHCIGIDPYYLAHKAIAQGYRPEIILAGRKLNENMPHHVASQVIKLMNQKRINVLDSKVLVLGLTFKENCPDIRNSKVVDLVREFESYNCQVDVYDPWVDNQEVMENYSIKMTENLKQDEYDAVILAVSHREFEQMGFEKINALAKSKHVIYDIKYLFTKDQVDGRL